MGKFEIKVAKNGEYVFNLKAANGQVILTSQMYKSKASCENGIASVKKNAEKASAFKIEEAKNGQPYFTIKAANGEIIGKSQIYASIDTCKKGIDSVQRNAPDAAVVELEAE